MGDPLLAGLLALDFPGDKPLTTSSLRAERNPCFLSILSGFVPFLITQKSKPRNHAMNLEIWEGEKGALALPLPKFCGHF